MPIAPRSPAADAVIVVNVLPAFAAIIRAVNAGFLFRFGGQIHALRIAGRNGDADAAEADRQRREGLW